MTCQSYAALLIPDGSPLSSSSCRQGLDGYQDSLCWHHRLASTSIRSCRLRDPYIVHILWLLSRGKGARDLSHRQHVRGRHGGLHRLSRRGCPDHAGPGTTPSNEMHGRELPLPQASKLVEIETSALS